MAKLRPLDFDPFDSRPTGRLRPLDFDPFDEPQGPMPEPAKLSPFPNASWVDAAMDDYTRTREGLDRLHAEAREAGVPIGRATRWKRKQLEEQALAGTLPAPERAGISLADVNVEDPVERDRIIALADEIQSSRFSQWQNPGEATALPGEGEDRDLTTALNVLEGYRRQTAPEVPGYQFLRKLAPRAVPRMGPEDPGRPADRSAFETASDLVASAGARFAQGLANAGVSGLEIAENATRQTLRPEIADALQAAKWRLRGRGAELDAEGGLRDAGGLSADSIAAFADELQRSQMPQRDGSVLGEIEYYANAIPGEIGRMAADLATGGLLRRGAGAAARRFGRTLSEGESTFLQMAPLSAGVAGNAYQEARARGLTPSEASAEMGKALGSELIPELIGVSAILGKLPVGQAAQRTISGRAGIAAGTEAGTELITAEAQIANEDWLRQRLGEAPLTEQEKQQMRQDALVIGAAAGGVLGGGAAALELGPGKLMERRFNRMERDLKGAIRPMSDGARAIEIEQSLLDQGADPAVAAGAGSTAAAFDNARSARPIINEAGGFSMPSAPGLLRTRQRLPGSLQGAEQPQVDTTVSGVQSLPRAMQAPRFDEDRSLADQLASAGEIDQMMGLAPQVTPQAAPQATPQALPQFGGTAQTGGPTLREQRQQRTTDGQASAVRPGGLLAVRDDQAAERGPSGPAGDGTSLPAGVRFADVAGVGSPDGTVGGVRPQGPAAAGQAPVALPSLRQRGRGFLPERKVDPAVRPFFDEGDEVLASKKGATPEPTFAPSGRRHGEAPEGAMMYGLFLGDRDMDAVAPEVADAFLELAQSPKARQLPTSIASELEKIAADVDPEVRVTREQPRNLDPDVREGYIIRMRDGNQAYLNVEEDGTLQLNAIELEQGQSGGAALYNIVNRFAAANGYKAEPDRNGLTNINTYRRTEQQAASALREGTTKHLGTSPDQRVMLDRSLPDKVNIGRLLLTGMGNVIGNVLEADQMSYNFDTGQFQWSNGEAVDDADFRAIAGSELARDIGAGVSTIKRAVFAASVVRATRGGARGADLGKVSREQSEQLASPALVKMLYSKPGRQPARGDARLGVTGTVVAPSGREQRALVERVWSALEDGLGKRAVARLRDTVLTVVPTRSALPQRVQETMSQDYLYNGLYHVGTGKAYIIADELDTDPTNVALHEVGIHYGLRTMMGSRAEQLIAEFQALADKGDAKVAWALGRAEDAGTPQEYMIEEAIAHYVERYASERSGLVAKIVDAIRAWLNQTLKIPLSVLGADTVIGVARGAVNRAGRGQVPEGAEDMALGSKRKKPDFARYASVASLESSFQMAKGRTFQTGRELKLALQDRLVNEMNQERHDLAAETPENEAYLTDMVVRDALYAVRANANAIGWYDKKVKQALAALALVHPEIDTDPDARFAFTYALAVTSNGLKVEPNFKLAEKAYREWRRSGRMPTDIGIGGAKAAINASMKLFNDIVGWNGIGAVRDFMLAEMTVSDIEAAGKTVSGENKSTRVRGAAILGAKIGNGFFSNLYGHFDALTIDRWLMRTWGRWTGSLVEYDAERVRTKTRQLRAVLDLLTPEQRKAFTREFGIPLSWSTQAVATSIKEGTQSVEWRERISEFGGELTDAQRAALTDLLGAEKADKPRQSLGDEIRKLGNALWGAIDGQKEIPANGTERNYIRRVFTAALSRLQEQYPDLTMADLQALLWYPEKRLYETAKEKDSDDEESGYDDDKAPDYANAAAKVAEAAGIPRDRIKEAQDAAVETPASDRSAGRGQRDAAGGQAGPVEAAAPPRIKLREAPQQARVLFEVAPNPDDAGLKARWDKLNQDAKTKTSIKIARKILPEILALVGLPKTAVRGQIGGYLDDSNPSLALTLEGKAVDQAAKIIEATKLAGFALSQQSMMVLSDRAFEGSFETGVITIKLPESVRSIEQVHSVYRQVRALDPDMIQGHTTVEGEMALAVPAEARESLEARIADALPADFAVASAIGHMAFPSEGDYDYGNATPESAPELSDRREDARRLRAEASRLLDLALPKAVDRVLPSARPAVGRRGAAGVRPAEGRQGVEGLPVFRNRKPGPNAVSATGVHYSPVAGLTSLDPTQAGSQFAGAERRRFGSGRFGLQNPRLNFYVEEDGTRPEREAALATATNVYKVRLENLYDFEADPDGLRADAGMNVDAFEESVTDAGYDGVLYPPVPGIPSRTAVLFGFKKKVPVQAQDVVLASSRKRDTITVDGKERPTTDSTGKQIHPTEEGLRNFWRWFGDSKVVDDEGRPLVVYHGGETIEAFDPRRIGRRDSGYYGHGFYFTPNKNYAAVYAGGFRDSPLPAGKAVTAAYVSLKNPVYLRSDDRDAGMFPKIWTDKKIAEGFDGAVVTSDDGSIFEIVSFYNSPAQIKSATGNTGAFDPTNPSILASTRRRAAAWQQTKDAAADARGLTQRLRALSSAATGLRNTVVDAAKETERVRGYYQQAYDLIDDFEKVLDAQAKNADAIAEARGLRSKALDGDRQAMRDLEKLTVEREAIKAEIAAAKRAGAKSAALAKRAGAATIPDIDPLIGQLKKLGPIIAQLEKTTERARKLRDWWKAREDAYYGTFDKATDRRETARQGLGVGIGPAVPNSAAFEIVATKAGLKWTGWRAFRRKARRLLQDRMIAWRDVQKDVAEQGGMIDDLSDVYTLETLMHGRAQAQFDRAERDVVEPMLATIAKHKLSIGEVEDYLEARYAQYRNEAVERRNRENKAGSGMTTEDANDYLAGKTEGLRGKQKLTPEKRKQLQEVEAKVRELTKMTRDKMLSSGLIDKDLHDTLSQDRLYVPLRHIKEGEKPAGDGFLEGFAADLGLPSALLADAGTKRGTGRGLDTRSAGLQRALGRTTRAENIIGELIGNYQKAVLLGEKNRAAQGILRMALQNRAPSLWSVEKVATEMRYSESTGIAYRAAKVDTQDPQTMAVFVDGVRYHVWLQEDLARAAKRMAEPELGAFMSTMSWANRTMSNLYTNLNPAFALVNPIRDAQLGLTRITDDFDAATSAKVAAGWVPARGALRALLEGRMNGERTLLRVMSEETREKWMGYAREFVDSGAMTGYVQALRPDQVEQRAARQLKRQASATGQAIKLASNYTVEWVSAANNANENGIRLAAYAALREKGLTVNQAARYAKDLTVNFNRKGELGAQINAISMFYNAAIQGSHAVVKMLSGKSARRVLATAAAMQAVIAFIAMDDYDEETGERHWDKLTEWEKQRNFIIPIGGGEYLKIPTGYGINLFPYLGTKVAEIMRRALDGDSDLDVWKAMGQFAGAVGTAFIPIETSLPGAVVPSQFRPIVDAHLGRNSFTGGYIAPPEAYDKYPTARAESYYPGTPGWAVAVARGMWLLGTGFSAETRTEKPISMLDWSPNEIEYMVRQYTGGPGAIFGGAMQAAADMIGGNMPRLDNPLNIPGRVLLTSVKRPERAVAGQFKTREQKFLRLVDEGKGIYMEKGEDAWEEFKERHAEYLSGVEIEEATRSGQETLIAKREDGFAAALKDVGRELRELRIARRIVINDTSLSLGERRRQSDEIEAQIAALQRQALLEFNTGRGR